MAAQKPSYRNTTMGAQVRAVDQAQGKPKKRETYPQYVFSGRTFVKPQS